MYVMPVLLAVTIHQVLTPPFVSTGQTFRDFCQCYKGWQGNDCSQRTCAYGLSFIDTPNGDLDHDNAIGSGYGDRLAGGDVRPKGTSNLTALNPMYRPDGWWEAHPSQLYGTESQLSILSMRQEGQEGHFYAECSNRGLCDRETGECVCFTGYTGTACNRTACPSDCSGHGICESIRERIPGSSSDVTDYMLWDADKAYGCVCDPEYFGTDCSKRRCYRNDDPLTSVTTTKWKSEKLSEQSEVQIVKVACANQGTVLSGSFTLTYTDVQFGETFTTDAHAPVGFGTDALAAADLKTKLEALPNQVLASHTDGVKIDSITRDTQTTPLGGTIYRYYVTFNSRLGDVPRARRMPNSRSRSISAIVSVLSTLRPRMSATMPSTMSVLSRCILPMDSTIGDRVFQSATSNPFASRADKAPFIDAGSMRSAS